MKQLNIRKLKEKLLEKNLNNVRLVNKLYYENKNNDKDLVIIGVTGSRGKTSTCVMIHEYLKSLGYKSVLYSSSTVDSPTSFIKKNEAFEVPVNSETSLLSIINEVEAYGADYLVLEVNDSTLEKGFLKDVDFDVRVLTNLNPLHNLEHYTKEEYVKLKKSFFENINEESKCVIGLQDYDKELFYELLNLNNNQKYTFTSEFIADVKNVDKNHFTTLLYEMTNDLNGLKFKLYFDGKSHEINTKLVLSYNAMNILCALTTLKALNVLDIEKFKKMIYDLKIPGRSVTYNLNNRLIIIDTHLGKTLECLKELKDKNIIGNIKVVTGSLGTKFKTWEERFNSKRYLESVTPSRVYAMELLKKYADYAYLTENDNASESVLEICQELQKYLYNVIPSAIIEDREKAIRKAILESNPYDAIFISGRGNRKVLCTTKDKIKLLKDEDVVEKVLKELKWKYRG